MWRWRPRKFAKKHEFLAKLFAVFFVGHCVVIFMIFFVDSRDAVQRIHIGQTLIDSDAKIIYCPLQKTMMKVTGGSKGGNTNGASGQSGASSTQAAAAQDGAAESAPRKSGKPTTALMAVPASKLDKKLGKKNSGGKKGGKKGKNKKQKASAKELNKKSRPLPQVEEKQKVEATSATQPKSEAPIQPAITEPAKVLESAVDAQSAEVAGLPVGDGSGGELIVYMGRDDMREYQIVSHMQQEIEQHWITPVGVSPDIHCTVRMIIKADGSVIAQVDESSGVLMYDIAARDAVQASVMPKTVWGKNFLIVL